MRKIVYYVASSLDGYISSPDESIEGFVSEGNGVLQYLEDLKSFDTVIMGRKTYEFGYKFGMKPGDLAYPHMDHYIFSNSLKFDKPNEKLHTCQLNMKEIERIRGSEGTDIYLCGGGAVAGWLLDHGQIDILKVKLNPLIMGEGVRLFGNSKRKLITELRDTKLYDNGLQILTYEIKF